MSSVGTVDHDKLPNSGKYKVVQKIGSGGYGNVYICEDINCHQKVAVKVESVSKNVSYLENEVRMYQKLKTLEGFPKLFGFKKCAEKKQNILSMELLGPSLYDVIQKRRKLFLQHEAYIVGMQILKLLDRIHTKGILHRDIKPQNIVTGIGKKESQLYLIDFGVAQQFKTENSQKQLPMKDGLSFVGTAEFASINAHLGREQSPRDDLESLGYTIVYLVKGSLPWSSIKTNKATTVKERLDKILEKKLSTGIEELCDGVPVDFQNLFLQCRKLKYEDMPDYKNLADLFQLSYKLL